MQKPKSVFRNIAIVSLLIFVLFIYKPNEPELITVYGSMHSKSLAGSCRYESPVRDYTIYLPSDYDKSNQRYPTLYVLHGYGNDHRTGLWFKALFELAINEKIIPPMLVVMPNSRTQFGGSFYSNSTGGGLWADYIAKDLVEHIDRHYRSIPDRNSRGLTGHSMGGFGVIKLAMLFPDVFGAAYAMSPGILNWAEELVPEHPAFKRIYNAKTIDDLGYDAYNLGFLALGRAFSANAGKPPFYCDVPVSYPDNVFTVDSGVIKVWNNQLPGNMLQKYHGALKRLNAFGMEWGSHDDRLHIPPTCRAFSNTLAQFGVPHLSCEFDGGHSDRLAGKNGRIYQYMLPFFGRYLKPE